MQKTTKKKIVKRSTPKKRITKRSNIDIKKLLTLKKTDCVYYIKRDGEIMRFSKKLDSTYQAILCLLKGNNNFTKIYFPYLYGDFNTILKKLIIIDNLQKNNFKYILHKKQDDTTVYPAMGIYLFNENNINNISINLFIPYIKIYDEKFYRKISPLNETKEENIIRYLGTETLKQKIKNINQTDDEILTYIFYTKFVRFIENELIKKYGMSLSSFRNYKQLYQFLECNGYVDKYYNKYGPKIIKRMNEFMKEIQNHPLFISFRDNLIKYEVKDLSDFSLRELVNQYVPTYTDKNKLWNSYLKLTK